MALFKILQGDSSRIDTSITPFHEGYAYFTPDDGKFYIDSVVNGVNKRICINPNNGGASKAVETTLLKGGWSSGMQRLTVAGGTPETNGVIGVAHTISDAQMEAAKAAEMYVCGQDNGTVTVAAFGDAPTTQDIPVVVILMG